MATARGQKRPSFANFNGGKEPEQFIFEDEQCVVFDETRNKQAPVHFLVVPKTTIPSLIETSVDNELLLGHMLFVAKQIAIERGLDRNGYHVMVDEEHQTKTLRSFHVFGRALHHMLWPVGPRVARRVRVNYRINIRKLSYPMKNYRTTARTERNALFRKTRYRIGILGSCEIRHKLKKYFFYKRVGSSESLFTSISAAAPAVFD